MMKKLITGILLFALISGGCASGRMGNPSAIAAGATIGGSLSNAVGGIVGENNSGWRGGYRGSAIGTIVGTIAGAAIGNAITAPREEKTPDIYIPRTPREEVYTPLPPTRTLYSQKFRHHSVCKRFASLMKVEIRQLMPMKTVK